ncbi:MAG: adenine-specific methyltransferase EcoRI family protein [Treponema sp.]|nr:adenine-specific methyltransferase EcoRI family protein [Treponema sp.]
MSKNASLGNARNAKEDEFYTQLSDIEKELAHYKEHFRNKTILCNCDDPRISNFFKYFALKFDELELKRLISTCYKNQEIDLFSQNDCEKAVWLDYYGNPNDPTNTDFSTVKVQNLNGDGDFRSQECIDLLKQADIVVTTPPFSLFREYVDILMKYDKKFLIIGSQNNITYKEIFKLFKENKIWLGYKAGDMAFKVPAYYTPRETRYWQDESGQKWRSMGNICWYTNLDIAKRHEDLILYKTCSPEEYPKYDNYEIINVNKVSEIPLDYEGLMGVPITFFDKYNPEQFEILGLANSARWLDYEFYTVIENKKNLQQSFNQTQKNKATLS